MVSRISALLISVASPHQQAQVRDDDSTLRVGLPQRDLIISQVLACLADDLPDRLTASGLPLVIPGVALPAVTGEILTVPF